MKPEEREADEDRYARCEPMTLNPCKFCHGICSGECSPEDFDEVSPRPPSVLVSRDAFDLPWHDAYEPQPMPTGARTPRDE